MSNRRHPTHPELSTFHAVPAGPPLLGADPYVDAAQTDPPDLELSRPYRNVWPNTPTGTTWRAAPNRQIR